MGNSHDPMRRFAHRFRRALPVLALFLVPTVTVAQSRLDPRVPKADEAAHGRTTSSWSRRARVISGHTHSRRRAGTRY